MFEAERHCSLVALHEGAGLPPQPAGAELWVLRLEEGGAEMPGPGGPRHLPPGSLLAAKSVQQCGLSFPAGAARLCGAALAGDAAARFAQGLGQSLALGPGSCPEAAGMLGRLMEEESPLRQSAAGFALLCLLAAAPAWAGGVPPLVAGALELIHSHYGEVYGVEELADELGVSRGHLIRSFSAALGQTPGRYLAGVRIEAAKRLLLQGVGLEAVAGLCGFSGANYFCRAFKKEAGLSPAAWKKQNAEKRLPSGAKPREKEWEAALYL